jgi:hypothetical protein
VFSVGLTKDDMIVACFYRLPLPTRDPTEFASLWDAKIADYLRGVSFVVS